MNLAMLRLGVALLLVCAGGTLRAAAIQPSNLPPGFCDEAVVGDLVLGSDMAFDTDAAACTLVVPQSGGPDLCVVRYHSIHISFGVRLTVTGTRPLVLTATDFVIDAYGSIDARALQTSNPDGAGGDALFYPYAGGGGGGNRTNGGEGGRNFDDNSGGDPGLSSGTAELVPLVGGGDGGSGSRGGPSGNGGRGGGALQLVACNFMELYPHAALYVNGKGGGGGKSGLFLSPGGGGGGGGAGGNVLLEANFMYLDGFATISANGGGGGGGGAGDGGPEGDPGLDGQNSYTAASGGLGSQEGAGKGGDGGTRNAAPQNGGPSSDASAGAGGGGGAPGRLRLNTCELLTVDADAVLPQNLNTGNSCDALFASGFEGPG